MPSVFKATRKHALIRPAYVTSAYEAARVPGRDIFVVRSPGPEMVIRVEKHKIPDFPFLVLLSEWHCVALGFCVWCVHSKHRERACSHAHPCAAKKANPS
jgi:hypothetical protein